MVKNEIGTNLDEIRDLLGIEQSKISDIFEHSLYGIHIKKDNDALSDTNPHICIGWSAMGDLSSVESREELGAKYEETWPGQKAKKKGQDVGQVWRFVKEMQVGDYVVFADGDVCHIGQIASDYYYDGIENVSRDTDYTNIRNVKWLRKGILKSNLSQSFQNSLGAAMSVWTLNDYKSAIYDLLNDTYVKDELFNESNESLEEQFKDWLLKKTTKKGELWASGSVNNCLNKLKKGFSKFGCYQGYSEFFEISEVETLEEYFVHLNKQAGVKEFDDSENRWFSKGLMEYKEFLLFLVNKQEEISEYIVAKGEATNKIFYGVPGCGKSYHIQHNILKKVNKNGAVDYEDENIIRTTFYQDYSNTDFVGQILPKIIKGENGEKDTVEYIFNPGPFTLALIQAISNPTKKAALVVEEINRGNAPAIFGDIFQLLDRDEDSISEYGIVNVGVIDYLNNYEFVVDGEKKRYVFKEIKIPGNLDIFATMNTSDQNVYTLDTAFTRRWHKERIPNNITGAGIAKLLVPGMGVLTWGGFVSAINNQIREKLDDLQVNEDKQVGVYFVKKSDLLGEDNSLSDEEKKEKARAFAYKVLEYLWDDVSKLDHGVIFNSSYKTFEDLVDAYVKHGITVFNSDVFKDKPVQETSVDEG